MATHFFLGCLPQDKQSIKLNPPIHNTHPTSYCFICFCCRSWYSLCQFQREKFLRKWDTPNYLHQFTVIIPLPLELQMTLSRNNVHNPWKCVTSGLQIRLYKSNSLFIDIWVKIILQTTSQNVTWLCITHKSDHHSPANLPRATAPSIMQGCVGTITQWYGNHTPLTMLPVVMLHGPPSWYILRIMSLLGHLPALTHYLLLTKSP